MLSLCKEVPGPSPGTSQRQLNKYSHATNLHCDAGVRVSMFRPRFR